MFKIGRNQLFACLLAINVMSLSSCALWKPLQLDANTNKDSLQTVESSDLEKFNGDYEVSSVDSNFTTLDYTFTYKTASDLKNHTGKKEYIKLLAINDREIKASLFLNEKLVKFKIVKGRIRNNFFEFHTTNISLKHLVFIRFNQQTNRIALSRQGDLYLDTNRGGAAFLLIILIPVSGWVAGTYNLQFKRKN